MRNPDPTAQTDPTQPNPTAPPGQLKAPQGGPNTDPTSTGVPGITAATPMTPPAATFDPSSTATPGFASNTYPTNPNAPPVAPPPASGGGAAPPPAPSAPDAAPASSAGFQYATPGAQYGTIPFSPDLAAMGFKQPTNDAIAQRDAQNAQRGWTADPATGGYDDPNTRAPSSQQIATQNAATNQAAVDKASQWFQSQGGSAIGANGQPIAGTQTNPGGNPVNPANPSAVNPSLGQTEGANIAAGRTSGAPATPGAPGVMPLASSSSPGAPGLGPATGAPSPDQSGAVRGVGISGIQPGQPGGDLRGSQILPTDQVDRFKLAQDRYNTMSQASDPAYQASLREATQRAAANGTMGSGMLNTDYGNLALQRGRDLEASKSTLLQNALEGTIGDSANNRAEYRGERGYQNALENQGYTRGVDALNQQDSLTNSAYNRAAGNYGAGNQYNPADQYNFMANIYGRNAAAAGQSAGSYAQARATNNALSQYGRPLTNAMNYPVPQYQSPYPAQGQYPGQDPSDGDG